MPQISVLGSGNLGLVYGTELNQRATSELIEEAYPGRLDGLADHKWVWLCEELINCHGGLGGYQTQPRVLYPAKWHLDKDGLVGAESVCRQPKNLLSQFDHLEGS